MLLSATNSVKAKLINLWVVFETIRINGPIPRSGIADETGMSKQAASDLVDELLSIQFIREQKISGRGVGKPPTPLDINPGGAFTLGFSCRFRPTLIRGCQSRRGSALSGRPGARGFGAGARRGRDRPHGCTPTRSHRHPSRPPPRLRPCDPGSLRCCGPEPASSAGLAWCRSA